MVRLTWTVYGEDIIDRELTRFSARNLNAAPAFAAIIEDIQDVLEEEFETEGSSTGSKWAPLKEETILAKAAQELDPRILHATLLLRESLTGKDDSAEIKVIDPQGFEFGSAVDYGPVHQKGAPSKNIPARPFLRFTEVDKRGFTKTLHRYLISGEVVSARNAI